MDFATDEIDSRMRPGLGSSTLINQFSGFPEQQTQQPPLIAANDYQAPYMQAFEPAYNIQQQQVNRPAYTNPAGLLNPAVPFNQAGYIDQLPGPSPPRRQPVTCDWCEILGDYCGNGCGSAQHSAAIRRPSSIRGFQSAAVAPIVPSSPLRAVSTSNPSNAGLAQALRSDSVVVSNHGQGGMIDEPNNGSSPLFTDDPSQQEVEITRVQFDLTNVSDDPDVEVTGTRQMRAPGPPFLGHVTAPSRLQQEPSSEPPQREHKPDADAPSQKQGRRASWLMKEMSSRLPLGPGSQLLSPWAKRSLAEHEKEARQSRTAPSDAELALRAKARYEAVAAKPIRKRKASEPKVTKASKRTKVATPDPVLEPVAQTSSKPRSPTPPAAVPAKKSRGRPKGSKNKTSAEKEIAPKPKKTETKAPKAKEAVSKPADAKNARRKELQESMRKKKQAFLAALTEDDNTQAMKSPAESTTSGVSAQDRESLMSDNDNDEDDDLFGGDIEEEPFEDDELFGGDVEEEPLEDVTETNQDDTPLDDEAIADLEGMFEDDGDDNESVCSYTRIDDDAETSEEE